MNKRKISYSSSFSFSNLKLSNDNCMIWLKTFTHCSKVAGMQSPVVVHFIFCIHCGSCLITRRWKKVFRRSRYATSTSRFTKKCMNGLTLNLITLEERPRNNKPSEYIALKACNEVKTCSNLETWAEGKGISFVAQALHSLPTLVRVHQVSFLYLEYVTSRVVCSFKRHFVCVL